MKEKIVFFISFSFLFSILAQESGLNLLKNPSFENIAKTGASGWSVHKGEPEVPDGYSLNDSVVQSGKSSILCDSRDEKSQMGLNQEIVFKDPVFHPLEISGWSKAENARGKDYCLWIDCWYADGSTEWGIKKDFVQGSHPWQRLSYEFKPDRPVKKIKLSILFRNCTGKVWFDNISVSLKNLLIEKESLRTALYGPCSLDYVAFLSLPASWKAELKHSGKLVYSTQGKGRAVSLAWSGGSARDQGGDYDLFIEAIEDKTGQKLEKKQKIWLPNGEREDICAWGESGMRRIFPHSQPPLKGGALNARVSMAGNEYESFQIALRCADKALEECSVVLDDLKNKSGGVLGKENINWELVGCAKVEQPYPHPCLPDGAFPGTWPDPLLPLEKFDLKPGKTSSLWFTVFAPPETPAGEYSAVFKLKSKGGDILSIPVCVKVFGFSLPEKPHISNSLCLMNCYLQKMYSSEWKKFRRAYGELLLKHKLNVTDATRTSPPEIDDLIYYKERGLESFCAINIVKPNPKRLWTCWSPLKDYDGNLKKNLIKTLDPYFQKLKSAGLDKMAYIYSFDERGKEYWPVIEEYFKLVKERYGASTLTTAQVPLDKDILKKLCIDNICVHISRYDYEKAEECRKNGVSVWAYLACSPQYPFGNWLLENPLIEARLLWWQFYSLRIDGIMCWGVNIWNNKDNCVIDPDKYISLPESSLFDLKKEYSSFHVFRNNGDGVLIYPGANGPLSSLRLANIRDGIEDYEYLFLLASLLKDRQKAERESLPLSSGLKSFARDPELLYRQREKIAGMIESLLKGEEIPDQKIEGDDEK
jgi:hypothetical protein